MARLPKQDWVDTDALDGFDEQKPDPLHNLFARNRERRGGHATPAPLAPVPPPSPPTSRPVHETEPISPQKTLRSAPTPIDRREPPVVADPKHVSPVDTQPWLDLLFAANEELSGTAVKILLASVRHGDASPTSLAQYMRLTGMKTRAGVLTAIRECLDWGWLTRHPACSGCGASLDSEDGDRIVTCPVCLRRLTPQITYRVHKPDTGVQFIDTGVHETNTEGVHAEDTGVDAGNTSPVHSVNTGVQSMHTEGVHKPNTGGVHDANTLDERIQRLMDRGRDTASHHGGKGVHKSNTGVPSVNTGGVQVVNTGVPVSDTPRAREDSESNVSNRIDSGIPPAAETGSGSMNTSIEDWRKLTEELARQSCRHLEEGDRSLAFHIKVWAHARKCDRGKGKSILTDGLFALLNELVERRKQTGKAQGPAWTRRARKLFDDHGMPMLTEAESAEWRELHDSYQGPPQL